MCWCLCMCVCSSVLNTCKVSHFYLSPLVPEHKCTLLFLWHPRVFELFLPKFDLTPKFYVCLSVRPSVCLCQNFISFGVETMAVGHIGDGLGWVVSCLSCRR